MKKSNMVANIKAHNDLVGLVAKIKLSHTGSTVHPARINRTYAGENIPSVHAIFDAPSRYEGQRMQLAGDDIDGLIAPEITDLKIDKPDTEKNS